MDMDCLKGGGSLDNVTYKPTIAQKSILILNPMGGGNIKEAIQ